MLREYFRRADATTEFDLRCSLLALAEGLDPFFNETRIVASARRSLASQANLDAWCFYRREFYSAKDINAAVKQDLDRRGDIADLPIGEAGGLLRAACLQGDDPAPGSVSDLRRTRETLARAEEALNIRIEPAELVFPRRFSLPQGTRSSATSSSP